VCVSVRLRDDYQRLVQVDMHARACVFVCVCMCVCKCVCVCVSVCVCGLWRARIRLAC
jgi:hypothetical protein